MHKERRSAYSRVDKENSKKILFKVMCRDIENIKNKLDENRFGSCLRSSGKIRNKAKSFFIRLHTTLYYIEELISLPLHVVN